MERSRRALTALALLAGCGPEEQVVRTKHLTADMRITSVDGLTSEAWVQLSDADGPLLLEGIDQVQVFIPGWLLDLRGVHDDPHYWVQIPEAPEATLYTIAILRKNAEGAPISEVVLPVAPDLVAPSAVSRSEELALSWPPDPDVPTTVSIEGDCVDPMTEEVGIDVGAWTIPAGTLTGSGSCELTVRAVREAVGVVDPALAGGEIRALQERSAVVSLQP